MANSPKKSTKVAVNGNNGSLSSPASPEITTRPLGPLAVLADKDKGREKDRVEPAQINNLNAADLKNACDDALKHVRVSTLLFSRLGHINFVRLQFLSHPDLFRQNHVHTDVRLALGWACVLVAFGTGLYGYKIEFEQAKPVVWVGVILWVIQKLSKYCR